MMSVVYHYNPTSNRNRDKTISQHEELYIIIILHQTATKFYLSLLSYSLYIIIILHQTATKHLIILDLHLLYIIIILHQTATQQCQQRHKEDVVYHYNPTSNRNGPQAFDFVNELYIIIILHQTAT